MRARERYCHHGPEPFGDAELLALVLGTGTARHSALELGAALLERYGDLPGLAAAEVSELVSQRGVGPARAVRLHAALELGRRARHRAICDDPVLTPADAFALLGPHLAGLRHEELHAAYLDRRHRPIAHRKLTRGNDAFTVVDPRQVFRPAVALGAAGVVLGHNHPSGDPTPSAQDHDVTRRVAAAGRILGISLVDHLVIGGAEYAALSEWGALSQWDRPELSTMS